MLPPETRLSLLARLGDAADEDAWNEFVKLYMPVIYRTALGIGLQDADAQEVVQQVLISVSKALAKRPHDPSQAKFRTWLSVVSRNATISLLRGKRPDSGSGSDTDQIKLTSVPDPGFAEAEKIMKVELQKEVFRAVAKEIEREFAPDTWKAFWLTTVDGKDIAEVAEELGKQTGSVYAARSRVMRRLRERTTEWTRET